MLIYIRTESPSQGAFTAQTKRSVNFKPSPIWDPIRSWPQLKNDLGNQWKVIALIWLLPNSNQKLKTSRVVWHVINVNRNQKTADEDK